MHSMRPISLKLGPSTVLLVLATGWTGCDGWPRYANKPATDADALSPGAPASNGVTIDWDEPSTESEDGIGPGDAATLGLMDGIVHSGEISGLGWDADASVDRLSACDNTLAFPPDAPGTYTGDVDWVTIEAQETGVLCLSLKTDPPEGVEAASARIDAVLYDLDGCDEPVAPHRWWPGGAQKKDHFCASITCGPSGVSSPGNFFALQHRSAACSATRTPIAAGWKKK